MEGFTIGASGIPSIPSRFLTIVSNNGEKRGFQQTAKRFQYETVFRSVSRYSRRVIVKFRLRRLVQDNIKRFNRSRKSWRKRPIRRKARVDLLREFVGIEHSFRSSPLFRRANALV
jgi:hypothetical protein